MKPTNNKLITFKVTKNILLAMCVLLFSLTAFGNYEISWHTIDGGGGQSSGGTYTLTGTIGQHDASREMQGGEFTLSGGFWPGESFCIVDFEHFAKFAQYWLDTGIDIPADLHKDADNIVNYADLEAFVYEWLYYCPYNWPLR